MPVKVGFAYQNEPADMKRILFCLLSPLSLPFFMGMHCMVFAEYVVRRLIQPWIDAWRGHSLWGFLFIVGLCLPFVTTPLVLVILLILWIAGRRVRMEFYLPALGMLNYRFRQDMKAGLFGTYNNETRD